MKKKITYLNVLIVMAIAACLGEMCIWYIRFIMGGVGKIAIAGAIFTAAAIVLTVLTSVVWRRVVIETRRRREEEIAEQEKMHLAEIARLNEENREKGEHFRSLLSHSLRMPVAVIQGYAELLLNDVVEDEEKKKIYLEKIVQRSQYMSEIISRNLTAEENIDITKLSLAKTDIIEISRQIALDMKLAAEAAGVTIQVLSSEENAVVMADSYLINRVLFNLIENSLKYMGRPGVVTVRIADLGESVSVSVRDDGMGLPENEVEHIFDYRYRGSNCITGSGYGLYLVKKTIDAHNGTILAQSSREMGMGITFTIPKNTESEESLSEQYI